MSDNECVWEEGIHDQTNDHWCKTHKVWSSDHPAPSPVQPDDQGASRKWLGEGEPWHVCLLTPGEVMVRKGDGEWSCNPIHQKPVYVVVIPRDDLAKRLREERAAAVRGFVKAVATHAARNGGSDKGQRFYDWGLNPWLDLLAEGYLMDLADPSAALASGRETGGES